MKTLKLFVLYLLVFVLSPNLIMASQSDSLDSVYKKWSLNLAYLKEFRFSNQSFFSLSPKTPYPSTGMIRDSLSYREFGKGFDIAIQRNSQTLFPAFPLGINWSLGFSMDWSFVDIGATTYKNSAGSPIIKEKFNRNRFYLGSGIYYDQGLIHLSTGIFSHVITNQRLTEIFEDNSEQKFVSSIYLVNLGLNFSVSIRLKKQFYLYVKSFHYQKSAFFTIGLQMLFKN